MKTLRWLIPIFFALPLSAFAQQAGSEPPALDCSKGPVSKTYGGTPWLVYACSDGKSVVAVTASGSPAGPFYFLLYPKDGKFVVVGEGTGSKELTDRTYSELVRLTEQDVADLILAAKTQRGTASKK